MVYIFNDYFGVDKILLVCSYSYNLILIPKRSLERAECGIKVLPQMEVLGLPAETLIDDCCGVAPGSTIRGTAARPIVIGTSPILRTTSLVFVSCVFRRGLPNPFLCGTFTLFPLLFVIGNDRVFFILRAKRDRILKTMIAKYFD
jgi:hypothetical protein